MTSSSRTTAASAAGSKRQRDTSTAAPRDAIGSLAWLHSRRDKDGQPLISAEQLAAGERLAADLWRARLTPRVTSVWTGVPGDGSGRRSAPGAGVDIADAVIAAKGRVERALRGVGPEFAGPLIDICGHMLGLDDIERINGLPTRSGKLLLRTALTRLARHYGYLPPEHGDAEIARRIAGWMADDGAVTLEGVAETGLNRIGDDDMPTRQPPLCLQKWTEAMSDDKGNRNISPDIYKIVITPQMIRAGVDAYLRWKPNNDEIEKFCDLCIL